MALLDAFSTLLGRPDPTMQLMARLGQAPGQPGGAAGPLPPGVAGATGLAGGGAAPTQQGAPQAAQGPPDGPGGPSAPTMGNGQPAPNAFASPSDLSQMYLQMAQRAQAERGFNSGLAMIAAGLYPGRTPGGAAGLANAMNAGVQDPNELFGNLMRLQTFGQEQQNYQALRQGLPQMLKDAGLSQDYGPLVMAQPGLLGDILKARMGVTGDPAERALQAARNDWLMQNPGKTEADMLAAHPEYSNAITYATTKTGQATTASAIAKEQVDDRNAAQKSLPALQQSTGDMLRNLDTIIHSSDDDLKKFVGGPIAANRPLTGAGVDLPGIGGNPELGAAIDQATRQTFGEGFREVAGKTSRVTNTEATSLSGSLSQLQTGRGLSAQDYKNQAQIVKDRILHTLGTAYGEAGLSDQLPDYLKASSPITGLPYLDSEYAPPTENSPGGSRYWKSGGSTPPAAYPGLASAAPKAPAAAAAPASSAASPASSSGGAGGGTPLAGDALAKVKAAIAANPHDRDTIISRVKANGFDTSGL